MLVFLFYLIISPLFMTVFRSDGPVCDLNHCLQTVNVQIVHLFKSCYVCDHFQWKRCTPVAIFFVVVGGENFLFYWFDRD